MRRLVHGVAALALVAAHPSSLPAQGTFEGQVVGTMSLPEGKSAPFRYYQSGNRTRQEYTVEGHTMSSIYDGASGDMIMLIPQQKKYMVWNLREASGAMRQMANAMGAGGGRGREAPDFTKMKVTPTGQRETIAGMLCEHYLFESTESKGPGKVDMCGAAGLGFMGMAGDNASMMPSTIALIRSQNPQLAKLARQGFFPLKMTISGERGSMVWQVTEIDRRRPDAALFKPPADYTQLSMPGMMGGQKP